MQENSDVFIITAPSGTGKTTLNRRLVGELGDIDIAVSLTTRQQRPGESNGDHYWFVKPREFQAAVQAGRMLEWAEVFGHLYGTSFDELTRIRKLRKKIILEIDVQGWAQAKPQLPGALALFIMPPTLKNLWERLQKRGTDSFTSRWRRIATARLELDQAMHYEYFMINDDLELAFQQLKAMIQRRQAPMQQKEGLEHCRRLIEEWDKSGWIHELKEKAESPS